MFAKMSPYRSRFATWHDRASGGLCESTEPVFPDDPPRRIVCRLIPPSGEDRPGRLRLAIQTSERVMRFETNFRVVP